MAGTDGAPKVQLCTAACVLLFAAASPIFSFNQFPEAFDTSVGTVKLRHRKQLSSGLAEADYALTKPSLTLCPNTLEECFQEATL